MRGGLRKRSVGHRDFPRALDAAAEGLLHQVQARCQLEALGRFDIAHQGPEPEMIARPPFGLDGECGVDGAEEAGAVQARGDRCQRGQAIVGEAIGGRRWILARDRGIDDGGQGVKVCPGAARGFGDATVLLDRRETGLERRGRRVIHGCDRMFGGSESEQHRSDRRQHDRVGADVLMPGLAVVQHRHRVEHRLQPGPELAFAGHVAELGEGGLQGRAFVEGHDHVGGAVLLPEAIDLDEGRMVEAGEQTGLVDEALQAGLEGIEMALGLDDDGRRAADARGHRGRHVLLDGDLALQRVVPAEVDESEAAFTDQTGDLVVAQPRAGRQRMAESGRGATGLPFFVDRLCRVDCHASQGSAAARRQPANTPKASTARSESALSRLALPVGLRRTGGATQQNHAIGAGAAGWRRRKNPAPCIVSTTSPCWFSTSEWLRTRPTAGRVASARVATTVQRMRKVSPGKTGLGQANCSTPGEPRAADSSR